MCFCSTVQLFDAEHHGKTTQSICFACSSKTLHSHRSELERLRRPQVTWRVVLSCCLWRRQFELVLRVIFHVICIYVVVEWCKELVMTMRYALVFWSKNQKISVISESLVVKALEANGEEIPLCEGSMRMFTVADKRLEAKVLRVSCKSHSMSDSIFFVIFDAGVDFKLFFN